MKYDKRYWTKLSNELNQYVEEGNYSERAIQIEHTGFFPKHVGFRGLNHNESSLLDFGTKLIEAEAIHFAYDRKYNSVSLYIRSTVHSENAGTYIEFTKAGKTYSVAMYDTNENAPHYIEKIVGKIDTDLFQEYSQNEFKDKLTKAGCNLLVFFRFNEQLGLDLPHHFKNGSIGTPNYIKDTTRSIEIGFKSVGTYNSLPNVIKIKRVKTIQSVNLYDLGAESKGYYSHDWKCRVPKSQARQVKAFAKRFKTAMKG